MVPTSSDGSEFGWLESHTELCQLLVSGMRFGTRTCEWEWLELPVFGGH